MTVTVPTLKLSRTQARRCAIVSTGLHKKQSFGRGKMATFRAIDQLGYIQIDTISVIERAHHHVLRSRVPNYRSQFIYDLQQKDRLVFEYWAHAAAFLPIKDYRFSFPTKKYFKDKKDGWPKSEPKLMKMVFERVKAEGPLMARDFEAKGHEGGTWWDWKPAKWALQRLFQEGDLMISGRQGFQKIYDLPERIIPDTVDQSFPDQDEYAQFLVERSLHGLGLATIPEMTYLRRGMSKLVAAIVDKMVEKGRLIPVQVQGLPNQKYYALEGIQKLINNRVTKQMHILSPFDNLLIQRKRTLELFGFDYQIECYVPRPKRKHGYFSLPILYGDRFIARMDSKADRKKKMFHVFNLASEDGVNWDEKLVQEFELALKEFMEYNQCHSIQIHDSEPKFLTGILTNRML